MTDFLNMALPCVFCASYDPTGQGINCVASLNSTEQSMCCDRWNLNPAYAPNPNSAAFVEAKRVQTEAKQGAMPQAAPMPQPVAMPAPVAMPQQVATPEPVAPTGMPTIPGMPVVPPATNVNVVSDLAAQMNTMAAQPTPPTIAPGMPGCQTMPPQTAMPTMPPVVNDAPTPLTPDQVPTADPTPAAAAPKGKKGPKPKKTEAPAAPQVNDTSAPDPTQTKLCDCTGDGTDPTHEDHTVTLSSIDQALSVAGMGAAQFVETAARELVGMFANGIFNYSDEELGRVINDLGAAHGTLRQLCQRVGARICKEEM